MTRVPIPLLLVALSLAAANGSAWAELAKPNVLFLVCDDLNCDVGCYDHPQVQTPHLDRLARRGVRFSRTYCQYPLCGPSRASFLTGLYPDQTLIRQNSIYLRQRLPRVRTMPQMFRAAGYHAIRIGKMYHYNVPLHIGTSGHDDPSSWDFTINPRGRDRANESRIFSLSPGRFGGTLSWLADDGEDSEQTDGIAAMHAARMLQKYAESKHPFFLAVGLYRPHTPFVAPKKYFDLYPIDSIRVPEVPEGYRETTPQPVQNLLTRRTHQVDLADHLARQAMQAYYASISFADAQLGKILDTLDETGLDENTIVLFTSDHGYHMGEHGHWQKMTLFENAARVPLIVAGPGVEATGQTTPALTEMIDFYPTLAELCGLTPPGNLSGKSLAPVLKDVSISPREAAITQCEGGYSIRTQRYRYTEWGKNGSQGAELYDHHNDPSEMTNLVPQIEHKKLRTKLSKLLHQRVSEAQKRPARLRQIAPGRNRE